eukprot:TRINITY_DN8845_c0_g1_i1.p1 TRINITY_DN8845_c0_g1~~TRINITY_DN8845_c0_g1_i1.p1  ORF type:complete len:372 (-),score=82.91 TRINITY_DN8845_c0_g1_i1:3-1118(-)
MAMEPTQAAFCAVASLCLQNPQFEPRYSYGERQRGNEISPVDLLAELLQRKPEVFVERYGAFLQPEVLRTLQAWFPDNFELSYFVSRLLSTESEAQASSRTRNRRWRKLQQLEQQGEFFSLHQMRLRQPLLYHHYVGRYEAKPPQFSTETPLSERILHQVDLEYIREQQENETARVLTGKSHRAQVQRDKQASEVPRPKTKMDTSLFGEAKGAMDAEDEEDECEEEDDDDEEFEKVPGVDYGERDSDDDPMEPDTVDQGGAGAVEDDNPAEATEEQRHEYFDEFVTLMKARFLEGRDAAWLDYAAIDGDATLDDIAQVTLDAEEKYFGADENERPATVRCAAEGTARLVAARQAIPHEELQEYNEQNNWGF